MNRIEKKLAECKNLGRKALVSYIVNGDPRADITLPAMHKLVEAGTDIIELGVPFSDPMAEGPIIQRGHERALENKISLKGSIELVAEFRKTNTHTPVMLMGYANPVVRMGFDRFAESASEAGVDGLLTVDLPPEESATLNEKLKAHGIENIFLVAPTTVNARIEKIVGLASGFIYYVSLKGVTGAGHLDVVSVEAKLKDIKSRTDLPVLVGFGIKDAETAYKIGSLTEGVVVGSVYVDAMGADSSDSNEKILVKLESLVKNIRSGLDKCE